MSQKVARLGDKSDHDGTITSASDNVQANDIGVARLGDTHDCPTHGQGTITSASTKVLANDRGVARIGDTISCGAVITTGSPNVEAG
jgi:uncharacterized Zn-binding protein involved in type VI secretion